MPALALMISVIAAACGSDPQLFYTTDTEANFLVSCADSDRPEPPGGDASADDLAEFQAAENLRDLQNRVCQCAIDRFRLKVPYSTFAEFDAELKADLEKPLQAASNEVLAECVAIEGDL